MKCTDLSMSLVFKNVIKIENFQIFHCMQSFHDVYTVFLYCDGGISFCTFPQNSLFEGRIGKMHVNKHLKQNISQGKERESLIMLSFWENHMDSPFNN